MKFNDFVSVHAELKATIDNMVAGEAKDKAAKVLELLENGFDDYLKPANIGKNEYDDRDFVLNLINFVSANTKVIANKHVQNLLVFCHMVISCKPKEWFFRKDFCSKVNHVLGHISESAMNPWDKNVKESLLSLIKTGQTENALCAAKEN